MKTTDTLIIFYQQSIDELRSSLLFNKDPFVCNSITVDINYYLMLISDRVLFINSQY
ncbi:MAG: hypothetical protein ACI87J_002678 [Colwellia sp.]|jgi:hypothetical protein